MPDSSLSIDQVEASSLLTDSYIALSKSPEVWSNGLHIALRHIAQACANAMGVQRASIWTVDEDLTLMECLCLYREDINGFEQGMELEARAFPRYFTALNFERVVSAEDARTDMRTKEFKESYLEPLDIHSMLDATVRKEGKVRGVLCLEHVGSKRYWNEEEQAFAVAIAELISQLFLFYTLRDRESRFRALFEGTVDSIFILKGMTVIECNPASTDMFRCSRENLLNSEPGAFSPELQPNGQESAALAVAKVKQALLGEEISFEWQHKRWNNELFDAEVTLSRVIIEGEYCVMATVRDISDRRMAEEALLESQRQLEYRATHDTLTDLPNRESLHQSASYAIMEASLQQKKIAVLLLDLNRFKDVNDTLGHRIGDVLLRQVATRLAAVLENQEAQLYRLGGDEFAVMLKNIDDPERASELAQQLNSSVQQPIEVEAMQLEMGASIGIALFPEHGENSHALLRCADVAMYYSKTHGQAHAFYDVNFDSHSTQRLVMLADLNMALRENHLLLHYQPRIDLQKGVCTGCEALLRWHHPQHGMVPPGDFIPLAEMTEIIHPLSLWVFRTALQQVRSWMNQGYEIPVAINLSARNLVDVRFPEQLRELLREFSVPNHLLEIEITESALITDPQRAMQVVRTFHDLGIHLAIDDFGTGYSSMSYLKKLPVQTLKIDRSFVMDMLSDEADAVIVRSTIGLAHSFGLAVVAEGVEDEETLQALRNLQCEQAQGYHISRPVPVDEFNQWYLGQSK